MAKTRNIKIIKEIKPKIKVIEKEEEEKEIEKAEEITEEPLEDLVIDAPSAREFPEFSERPREQEPTQMPPEITTPSATTGGESKGAVRYQIQTDITEEEIERTYRTEVSEAKPIPTMLSTTTQERIAPGRLSSRELEAVRTRDEEKRYEISFEPEKPVKKRKYPWE
jgi:hypothetical protein